MVVKIQSWIEIWKSISLFVFCFFIIIFVFEMPLKDFPFYSPILLTLWFRYLQTCIKEKCMYLSSQLFFKTSHKTLKFQEKSPQKCIFQQSTDLNFKIFPFIVYHRATSQSYWTKQTVKKLNLWRKTAVDISAWIKAG